MVIAAVAKVGVVNGISDGWENDVRRHIASGTNFLLILPDDPAALKQFCIMFGLKPDCKPSGISRADFLLLSHHTDREVFDEVLKGFDNEQQVAFVEQLDFPLNRPPNVKPFLLYSSVLGIVSQHDDLLEAREARDEYHTMSQRHEACLYSWIGMKWELLRDSR